MKQIRIVGSGLIGTSMGLALVGQKCSLEMVDNEPSRAKLAQELVGTSHGGGSDLVILATPASALPEIIRREFHSNPKAKFIDIASTKTKSQLLVETIEGLPMRFCGTHPMAGREVGGPQSARADLFQGRPWVYTPSKATQSDVTEEVLWLICALGGQPILMSGKQHDEAVALISHLPQIGASLIAHLLQGANPDFLALAGQGLRDTTRIASSDPKMWSEIIVDNRGYILPLLAKMNQEIGDLISHLDQESELSQESELAKFIQGGNIGQKGIPGKHGGVIRNYHFLSIVIQDKAGQLAQLFRECAEAGVNIEDLSIEHSPGQLTGLITLALSPIDAPILAEHLSARGWSIHDVRK